MERSISFERTVALDYDAAVAALRDQPGHVVLADPDTRELELHADVAGFDVARTVTVTLGDLRQLDKHAVALPIKWEATEHPRRFPTMDGMVELSALSHRPAQSQLALVGTVTTPLGVLGSVGEAAGGTELGDSVLEALVDRMVDRLAQLVADRAAGAASDTGSQHLARPRFVRQD